VVGVDVSTTKVELINSGKSPLTEAGLEDLIETERARGRLIATTSAEAALRNTEVTLICVGTPSNGNGSVKLEYLENVCAEVGTILKTLGREHTVVIRSTVLPNTGEQILIPMLQRLSGGIVGADRGFAMNPEFLREGTAVWDFNHPSHIIIGSTDERTAEIVTQLYRGIEAPVATTSIKAAEMIKYVSNAFHALKIVFANEIGNICKAHGADGREIMHLFCQDDRLNISPAYLKPGFGFGGSCLPKDMRALLHTAQQHDVDCPLLRAVLDSNQKQIQRGIDLVEHTGRKKIGVLGLSFKAGTDDIRESAAVPLVETLVGRGYEVSVYDPDVKLDHLIGNNKVYLERELPHIAHLMKSSISEVIRKAEVIVLTNSHPLYKNAPELLGKDQLLIDLVGIPHDASLAASYQGICW